MYMLMWARFQIKRLIFKSLEIKINILKFKETKILESNKFNFKHQKRLLKVRN